MRVLRRPNILSGMDARGLEQDRIAPSAAARACLAAVSLGACRLDAPGVSLPRPEAHLVARFGPPARQGLDLHVMGARRRAHRKVLRGGLRTVMLRLRLDAHEAVLGVSPSELAGQTIPLEELWGAEATRLWERLARCQDLREAAAAMEDAIVRRAAASPSPKRAHDARLAIEAAAHLRDDARISEVADALGTSERHLRRVFRDAIGMGPKEFSRLTRFHRAVDAARASRPPDWAAIAASTGYYDQAHLIAEFREIAGATPRTLSDELGLVGPSDQGMITWRSPAHTGSTITSTPFTDTASWNGSSAIGVQPAPSHAPTKT